MNRNYEFSPLYFLRMIFHEKKHLMKSSICANRPICRIESVIKLKFHVFLIGSQRGQAGEGDTKTISCNFCGIQLKKVLPRQFRFYPIARQFTFLKNDNFMKNVRKNSSIFTNRLNYEHLILPHCKTIRSSLKNDNFRFARILQF